MRAVVGGLGCGFILSAVALGACGSSTNGSPSPGSGGGNVAPTAGGAGASGGAAAGAGASGATASSGSGAGGSLTSAGAGGGAGLVLGNSKTEACIGYVLAQCARRAECEGASSADCILSSLSCPDLMFSEGSTRTVENLQACAAAYKTFACDQLLNDMVPACATAGTKALDTPCAFPSQCASLECQVHDNSGCGMCAKTGAEGDDCSAHDVVCGGGLWCADYVRTCQLLSPAAKSIYQDKPCQAETDCGAWRDCPSATHVCSKFPGLGVSCAEFHNCAEGYCDSGTLKCSSPPPLGAQCGGDPLSPVIKVCATGSLCDPATNTCVKSPVIGEACVVGANGGDPQCAGGFCDMTLTPPRCVTKAPSGSNCAVDDDSCMDDLRCMCPDGAATCGQTVCVQYQLAGAACGPGVGLCHPGFSCTAGKCQPLDSRGTFAKYCPG